MGMEAYIPKAHAQVDSPCEIGPQENDHFGVELEGNRLAFFFFEIYA